MVTKPKFTIILPAYNCEKYILKTLESIKNQSFKDFELIVIDNESKDSTYQILKDNQEEFGYQLDTAPNIYKHSHEEPVLKALEKMSGEWFTIIGADDVLEPDYFNNYNKIITRLGTKYKCFQSAIQMFNGDVSAISSHAYNDTEQLKKLYLQECPVNTPTVFYHNSLKKYYIPCSKDYLGAQDYYIYGNLIDSGVYIYPIPLFLGYKYRIHANQATWGMQKLGMDKKIQDYWREKWKM